MDPEIWVAVAAVFVSGGAIGSTGTLLAQWLLKKVDVAPRRPGLDVVERDALRSELAELHKHMRNMDARLDFTERLLDGALPIAPAPERLPAPEAPVRAGDERADPTGSKTANDGAGVDSATDDI